MRRIDNAGVQEAPSVTDDRDRILFGPARQLIGHTRAYLLTASVAIPIGFRTRRKLAHRIASICCAAICRSELPFERRILRVGKYIRIAYGKYINYQFY